MQIKKVKSDVIKLYETSQVKLKTAGNTREVQFMAGNNNRCPKGGSSSRAYQSTGRMSDDLLLNPRTNTRGATNLTEWRRSISKSDIKSERIKFLGEDAVKIDGGVWRSLDGTRQFRVVEADYLGRHGIGSPLVPNTPHVHFEFLGLLNAGGNKLKVIKNVHVPLR